ncbi:hypothetical protein SODALDRAFT_83186 [Sodiomyces alkalinus F11]|uniref:Uncharacterized protein n=1 Tax=Sodiomyces alkalinus (strain CBS 110278 / VKM F-3762 / F11) TaxID=1314773 RepID=A0A3N2PJK1_SODAK|nr:hypothetical protein SODALDRAFT_83186 [Sodiomyces alkalinus F11]ROT34695.1 hypothetical protein SODALDRAFT_83186 [Sodiomyces alkalinus F11]
MSRQQLSDECRRPASSFTYELNVPGSYNNLDSCSKQADRASALPLLSPRWLQAHLLPTLACIFGINPILYKPTAHPVLFVRFACFDREVLACILSSVPKPQAPDVVMRTLAPVREKKEKRKAKPSRKPVSLMYSCQTVDNIMIKKEIKNTPIHPLVLQFRLDDGKGNNDYPPGGCVRVVENYNGKSAASERG